MNILISYVQHVGKLSNVVAETSQCQVCGGWFNAGHFCIGKNENTPEKVDVKGLYAMIEKQRVRIFELEDLLNNTEE